SPGSDDDAGSGPRLRLPYQRCAAEVSRFLLRQPRQGATRKRTDPGPNPFTVLFVDRPVPSVTDSWAYEHSLHVEDLDTVAVHRWFTWTGAAQRGWHWILR